MIETLQYQFPYFGKLWSYIILTPPEGLVIRSVIHLIRGFRKT
jgi:hypothetical protein